MNRIDLAASSSSMVSIKQQKPSCKFANKKKIADAAKWCASLGRYTSAASMAILMPTATQINQRNIESTNKRLRFFSNFFAVVVSLPVAMGDELMNIH